MRPDRTRPVRFYNRRGRKLAAAFTWAIACKVHREERREAFEAQYAPLYADYGRRVHLADIKRADEAAFLNGGEVLIVEGRIVIEGPDA